MRKMVKILIFLLLLSGFPESSYSDESLAIDHPIQALVGEHFIYDVSFLWFEHLAEGSMQLTYA